MRVIAGEFKGRPLKAVPGKKTRPTTDKVKEALFHRIGPYFDGGDALDLFAGSGGLGIEALSRGMDHVVFVDQQGQAIKTIQDNVKTFSLSDRCDIFRQDAFRAIKAAHKQGRQFDMIFLDPPYGQVSFDKLLAALRDYNVLRDDALIICEHPPEETLQEDIQGYEYVRTNTYSQTIAVTTYRYKNQEEDYV
ncbi:16S rRNA (guanine966-N2)-methyltransferase [Alkalibacillus flavidus]|uniref:16S rRNA (Guanine966-N2)-methyltransferase n=2 Tax=Alkalibacillus flavidus TaxID=546021 RepID=A0ABV2KR20_9BACI